MTNNNSSQPYKWPKRSSTNKYPNSSKPSANSKTKMTFSSPKSMNYNQTSTYQSPHHPLRATCKKWHWPRVPKRKCVRLSPWDGLRKIYPIYKPRPTAINRGPKPTKTIPTILRLNLVLKILAHRILAHITLSHLLPIWKATSHRLSTSTTQVIAKRATQTIVKRASTPSTIERR